MPAVSAAALSAQAPPLLVVADARARIRAANQASGSRIVVLDDDPTGSQSVHDVPVLTRWSRADVEWAFAQPGPGFFILTNTRGLNADEARATVDEVSRIVESVAAASGVGYSVVSRSDSTLRGHYPLETDVLAERAAAAGAPFDVVLLVPAYIAAGRVTVGGVHYAREGSAYLPVGETGYARDATFGFASSALAEYVAERTGGRIPADAVVRISLTDIRVGGAERVRDILLACRASAAVEPPVEVAVEPPVDAASEPVVVDALTDDDLDIVTLGLLLAEEAGVKVLCRTGPSFVASRFGIQTREPLTAAEIFPDRAGAPAHTREDDGRRNGLIVVGSHVALTTAQVDRLREVRPAIAAIELTVPLLLDPVTARTELDRCARELIAALRVSDALLVTSRERIDAADGRASLVIAQTVSHALVELTRQTVAEVPPSWVLAKGGITSSDIATSGLGIHRATVAGQLFDGIVSVWVNRSESRSALDGLPYIVFAGNVGDESTLARAVAILHEPVGTRAG